MTQDNEKREEIRRKTAQAIGMIDTAMIARHKLPNDQHNIHDVEGIARRAGETMIRHMHEPDFSPLALLLEGMHQVQGAEAKLRAETNIALYAMAKAFGIEHQFNMALAVEDIKKAASSNGHPPQSGPGATR